MGEGWRRRRGRCRQARESTGDAAALYGGQIETVTEERRWRVGVGGGKQDG